MGLLGLKPKRRLEAALKTGGCSGYLLFLPSILFARASPAAYAGQADPQVPRDRDWDRGAYGAIGAFYFYAEGSRDDPAFGLCDIEVSVQSVADGKVRLELIALPTAIRARVVSAPGIRSRSR